MARRLAVHVHVDGVAYGPDDEVPDTVAGKITAPDVWAEADEGGKPKPPRAAKS